MLAFSCNHIIVRNVNGHQQHIATTCNNLAQNPSRKL